MQNKEYSDYFKALEEQLNKTSTERKEISSNNKPQKEKNFAYKNRVKKSKKPFLLIKLPLKAILACVFSLTILISGIYLIANINKDKPNVSKTEQTQSGIEKVEENTSEKIVFNNANSVLNLPDSNDAQNAIIVNLKNNEIILSKNAHSKAYPASTTKIMTLLVACENMSSLDDTFTMSLSITDPLFTMEASVVGFLNQETITVEDMLYGTILPSGADAAVGLAIKIAGSEENFVKLMNQKVKELGLTNTHFANVSGLHSEENYSSAYDMAVILAAAIKNPICKKILSTYQYTTSKTQQHPDGILISSTLFENMYGTEPETATILGGKTGFVSESGYCVASFGKANKTGNEYIVVTLNNSGKWPAFYGQIDLYKNFAK